MAISPVTITPVSTSLNSQSPSVARRDNETVETRRDREAPERNAGVPAAQSTLQVDRTNETTAAKKQALQTSDRPPNSRSDNATNTSSTATNGTVNNGVNGANPGSGTNFLADIAQSNRVSQLADGTKNVTAKPSSGNNTSGGNNDTQSASVVQTQVEDINAKRLQDSLQAPRLGQGVNLNI